jgi:arginine decarboxylase
MDILLTSAVGRGPTELAAFDAALVTAGVADRNLIYLSSVLPPASAVRRVDRIERAPGTWGDRLYCVMARASTGVRGQQVWAGVGWGQDSSGRGLLVEHHAQDEASLGGLVSASLDGLCRNRGISLPSRGVEVAGASCTADPVCALVIAVFEAAAWSSAIRPIHPATARARARARRRLPASMQQRAS